MRSRSVLIVVIFSIAKTSSQSSSEETPGLANSVNFNDIFSNSFKMLADDTLGNMKDDYVNLSPINIPFSMSKTSTKSPTTTTSQRPKDIRDKNINGRSRKISDMLLLSQNMNSRQMNSPPAQMTPMEDPVKARESNRRTTRLEVDMSGPKSRFLKASYRETPPPILPTFEYSETTTSPESVLSLSNGTHQKLASLLTPLATSAPLDSLFSSEKTGSAEIMTITTNRTTTNKPTNMTTIIENEILSTNSGKGLNKQQRGVLDLILPKERLESFKGVFDKFRRLLSYTFK